MNNQKSEHRSTSSLLEVHSIFKTIQGEGPFSGTPCVFVRLAGCNLQCPKCDTDYTSNRTKLDFKTILALVERLQTKGLVVITGGEPFRQSVFELLRLLYKNEYYVQVETNGTIIPPEVFWNKNIANRYGYYLVCSPKTQLINDKVHQHACAFKYVLNHKDINEDGLPNSVLGFPTKLKVARPSNQFTGQVYLQPEDSYDIEENEKNEKAVIKSCLEHGYIFNMQLHKYLGLK